MRLTLTVLVIAACQLSYGAPASPDCEASPEIRRALAFEVPPQLGGAARTAARLAKLEELAAKYPGDFFILYRLERDLHFSSAEDRARSIERFLTLKNSHPGEARYVVLYARSLVDTQTGKALEVLKSKEAAGHPFAHIVLADIYGFGTFVDRVRAREELDRYFTRCPASMEGGPLDVLNSVATPELARKHLPALRARLSSETSPDVLRHWQTVWNLEFKARPVGEHEALRKEIAEQVADLESTIEDRNERWLSLIRSGYQQANREAEVLKIESQLQEKYPNSATVRFIERDRWNRDHPFPGMDASKEVQTAFYETQLHRADELLQRNPGEFEWMLMRFNALRFIDDAPADQAAGAAIALMTELRKGVDWYAVPPFEFQIAQVLVKKKKRIDEVPRLVDEGIASYAKRSSFRSDRDPEELRKADQSGRFYVRTEAAKILIDAAKELARPEIYQQAVAEVEALKPEKWSETVQVMSVRAKLAEAQSRKLDALLILRGAAALRPANLKLLKDDLKEDIERLYKELGGTEAARSFWDAVPESRTASSKDGRWETPKVPMKSWELSDLTGKIWKMRSLEGKTVLINVWATWCGPCQFEHPHLEKLYQMVKNRPDVQLITFNVDEEIGKVKPYMDQKKYSFPVLLAKNYVDELLPALSIPRNWILTPKGEWTLEQIGFGNDAEWEKGMLEKLESVRPKP